MFFCLFLLLLTAFPSVSAPAAALPYFTFSLDKAAASGGELVRVNVLARNVSLPAAGFRASVSYDDGSLTFLGMETSSQIKGDSLEVNPAADPVCCVYVCDPAKGYAPALTGTVLSFVFQVKNSVKADESALDAKIDEICDFDGNSIGPDCTQELTLNLSPAPSDSAYLTALVPSAGKLSPGFSPDVLKYDLNVAYGVDSVVFEANAYQNGTIRVSRKSLGRPGTDTPILVTVTSAGRSASCVYRITVHREAPDTAEFSAASSRAKKTAAPKSSAGQQKRKPSEGAGGLKTGARGRGRAKTGGVPSASKAAGRRKPVEQPFAGTGAAVSETVTTQSIEPQKGADSGDRPSVVVEGNQMPPFLTGQLVTVLCIVTGIALSLWFSRKPKQP